ncbi:MAG: type II toxin-antitoxin system PemK/MazF family toxin [Proteobacteria bacterium]|nr:type II toxin-antitoxin system PemK/MazF family toxin [Pseudomonadota bacterium]
MNRGDVVTIALPGAYGKPRPAVVVQSELFQELPSLTILPITSEIRASPLLRITVQPSADNGLRKPSQVMIDKIQTVPQAKVGAAIGYLARDVMKIIDRSLIVFLGIA